MNSRDAAYDEEEQLLRAIEESKEDNKTKVKHEGPALVQSRHDSSGEDLQGTLGGCHLAQLWNRRA